MLGDAAKGNRERQHCNMETAVPERQLAGVYWINVAGLSGWLNGVDRLLAELPGAEPAV